MKTIRVMLVATALAWTTIGHAGEAKKMTVYKSPWCGCCESWSNIMKDHGFTVEVKEMEDLSLIKKQAGIPQDMEGCHTAVLGSYTLEGHVPVPAIEKLMEEQPAIRGIAVPGMPEGSPGMGDDPHARYSVYAVPHNAMEATAVFYEAGR